MFAFITSRQIVHVAQIGVVAVIAGEFCLHGVNTEIEREDAEMKFGKFSPEEDAVICARLSLNVSRHVLGAVDRRIELDVSDVWKVAEQLDRSREQVKGRVRTLINRAERRRVNLAREKERMDHGISKFDKDKALQLQRQWCRLSTPAKIEFIRKYVTPEILEAARLPLGHAVDTASESADIISLEFSEDDEQDKQ